MPNMIDFLQEINKQKTQNFEAKHNIPASREWSNNTYTYNKSNTKLLPVTDNLINNLIKSYFNLSLLKNNKKSRRIEIRFKRLSLNTILVSKAETKHTNNKAIVNVYIYNKNKKFLALNINNLLSSIGINQSNENNKKKLNKYIENIKITNKRRKNITLRSISILNKIRKHKTLLFKGLNWNDKNFQNFETRYYKDYLEKLYKQEMLYLYYAKLSSFNDNKLKNWFLIGIKSLLSKIYKKKIELNIVSLNYLQFNTDNFIEAISIKLKNRNNRLLKVLKKAVNMVRIPSIRFNYTMPLYKSNSLTTSESNLEMNLSDNFKSDVKYRDIIGNNIVKSVLNSTKYKSVNGVRLESAGRLSKRITASRSVFKHKYKGSLKDTDSSYNGISSSLYRGFVKPNIQQTNLSSKTRNGAFGLKGWISNR